MRLKNKTAIITGGAGAIGHATAKRFLNECAEGILLVDNDSNNLKNVMKELESDRIKTFTGDVSKSEDVEKYIEKAIHEFGTIDILFLNAGIEGVVKPLTEYPEEIYDKVMNVNLKGPFRLASLVGNRMNQEEGGSIVNISSIAAIKNQWHTTPYAMAKAGLNAMTRCVGDAYAPKVRVNAIMCGPFRTNASKSWADSEQFNWRAEHLIPMHRIGDPEEVVGAALYFASNLSSYTTRTIVTIDGGET